jgi:hypothetical protein
MGEWDLDVSYLKKERAFATVFIFLICLGLTHLVHEGWFVSISQMAAKQPAAGTPIYYLFQPSHQPLHAPEAYRVAIPTLGAFLMRTFHLKDPAWVAAGLDLFFSLSALYFFYRLAVDTLPITQARVKERMLTVALFLAFIQFPIAWIVPWQRPETLPTALFLALALFCLVRAKRNGIWTGLLLATAACQAFVRSDVPFVFGIALIVLAIFGGKSLEEFGSRPSLLLKGACITFIAGGIQVFLQFIRYPHLSYWPGTDVIQFKNNLHFHNFSNCILALLPFLIPGSLFIVRRRRLEAVHVLVIAASALYFPLWFTVGIVGEVRLFVPFLMALSVVAARGVATFLTDEVCAGVISG